MMAEFAPNLFVSSFLPSGTAYVIDLEKLLVPGAGRGLAISQADWDRFPAAERELVLDDLTRQSAEAALERLEAWLAGESPSTGGQE